MKYFESISIRSISIANDTLSHSIKRKSTFARFIEALHISRRCQARHLIHRYRHLIATEFPARSTTITAESSKATEGNVNANGNQTPVAANDRVLTDA